jgi:DNA-binding transcriptional ArsR family regulator
VGIPLVGREQDRKTVETEDDVCEVLYIDESRVETVAAQMPDDKTIREVTGILKVLSDHTRVKIVFALSRAELCVCDIAALLGLSISAVSHQLRLLRGLKLVKYRREGRLAYYTLDDEHTEELLVDVLEHVRRAAG